MDQYSAVSIVITLRTGQSRIRGLIPGGVKERTDRRGGPHSLLFMGHHNLIL